MVKTTNLRLNLDKPDHRKTYDILKSSDMSHTKTIVAALISFSENEEKRKHLFDGIREIVREEIKLDDAASDPAVFKLSFRGLMMKKFVICASVDTKHTAKRCDGVFR